MPAIFRTTSLAFLLLVASQCATASLISISIQDGSQSFLSRPQEDQLWSVNASGGSLDISHGIGIIANPIYPSSHDQHEFALHQDQQPSSTPYIAPHVPDPTSSTVTFGFDIPTIIRSISIVQHQNGVTAVTGASGDSLSGMTGLGTVFGPSGDVSGFVVPNDGDIQTFDFGNTSIAGTLFQVTIAKTNHASAYALYRIFLNQPDGSVVRPFQASVPEPETFWLTTVALLTFATSRRVSRKPTCRSGTSPGAA